MPKCAENRIRALAPAVFSHGTKDFFSSLFSPDDKPFVIPTGAAASAAEWRDLHFAGVTALLAIDNCQLATGNWLLIDVALSFAATGDWLLAAGY